MRTQTLLRKLKAIQSKAENISETLRDDNGNCEIPDGADGVALLKEMNESLVSEPLGEAIEAFEGLDEIGDSVMSVLEELDALMERVEELVEEISEESEEGEEEEGDD